MSTIETDAPSEVLTIDEAAAILRISRNAAYAAAREWRATGGKTGIPCIEIGRTLRVPRADLDRIIRTDASKSGVYGAILAPSPDIDNVKLSVRASLIACAALSTSACPGDVAPAAGLAAGLVAGVAAGTTGFATG